MDATLIKDGSRYTVRFERKLAHSPEKVWQSLTERELLQQVVPKRRARRLGGGLEAAVRVSG
jgi:uncharacterized protein YndB with AHSA1/START domain